MIGKSDQKGFSAVGSLFSDSLLGRVSDSQKILKQLLSFQFLLHYRRVGYIYTEQMKSILTQVNSHSNYFFTNLHIGPPHFFQMDTSIHHLGSFEAGLEVGWVHFITISDSIRRGPPTLM